MALPDQKFPELMNLHDPQLGFLAVERSDSALELNNPILTRYTLINFGGILN